MIKIYKVISGNHRNYIRRPFLNRRETEKNNKSLNSSIKTGWTVIKQSGKQLIFSPLGEIKMYHSHAEIRLPTHTYPNSMSFTTISVAVVGKDISFSPSPFSMRDNFSAFVKFFLK